MYAPTQTFKSMCPYRWLGTVLLSLGLGGAAGNVEAWYNAPPFSQRANPNPAWYAGRTAVYPYYRGGQALPQWYLRGGRDRFGGYHFEFRVRGNARQFYNMWLMYQMSRPGY